MRRTYTAEKVPEFMVDPQPATSPTEEKYSEDNDEKEQDKPWDPARRMPTEECIVPMLALDISGRGIQD